MNAEKKETNEETRSRRRARPVNLFGPLGNYPPGYLILWALTLGSVVMNVIIIRQILLARQIAQQSIRDTLAVIENLQGQVIDYTVVVDENLPIKADIPVRQTIPIMIDEDFPLDTIITVRVPTPLGELPVNVPISTTIPVHRTVNISVDQTFALDTSIPVFFEVPVVISVEQTPLFLMLEETRTRLLLLELSLRQPLLPFFPDPDANEPTQQPEPTVRATATP